MKKVIWVDDDSKLMSSLKQMFNDYGIEIIECDTIAKALKAINTGISQNVLLDIDFHGNRTEGLIFLESLKKIKKNLNIVIFTGYPELSDAVNLIREELVAHYIEKKSLAGFKERKEFFDDLHKYFKEPVNSKQDIHSQIPFTSIEDFYRTKRQEWVADGLCRVFLLLIPLGLYIAAVFFIWCKKNYDSFVQYFESDHKVQSYLAGVYFTLWIFFVYESLNRRFNASLRTDFINGLEKEIPEYLK